MQVGEKCRLEKEMKAEKKTVTDRRKLSLTYPAFLPGYHQILHSEPSLRYF